MFAGVGRNSVTYEQIKHLAEGGVIIRDNIPTFYKSLERLEIKIKDTSLTVKANADKSLKDNKYKPLHINLIDNELSITGNPLYKIMKSQLNAYNQAIKLHKNLDDHSL